MAGGIKKTAEFSKIEIASVVKRDPATEESFHYPKP